MYVRISTQIDETYDEAGELPVTITYDIEGDECTAEPYSWGVSRGTDLNLSAEVYNVRVGALDLSRDQAVQLFSDDRRDGEQFLQQLEEYAAERAAMQYRQGEFAACAANYPAGFTPRRGFYRREHDMKPTKIQMCRIAYHASQIGQNANAVYWLECEGCSGEFLRKKIIKGIEDVAAIFGMELVETEADDEPTPPTYDEALATKCDAEAREWDAMQLKGMV